MHIHYDMPGSDTILLALNGTLVRLVVEADTREGWLRRYVADHPRPDAVTSGAIERVEGAVDFVGDTATDPDWMIAQRLAAIRQRLKLPPAEVPARLLDATPLVLEQLAARLRLGEAEIVSLDGSCKARGFPVTDGTRFVRSTGRMELRVTYVLAGTRSEFEKFEAEWCRANPALVPEYVRSIPDEERNEKRTP